MKNLVITAHLTSPVCSSDFYLPFDSLILALYMRSAYGQEMFSLSSFLTDDVREKVERATLPLEKRIVNGELIYSASFCVWPDRCAMTKAFYNKTFDLEHSDYINLRASGKIDTSRGRYKKYHNSIYIRHAQSVKWYCVGEKDEIESLLSDCTNIGKKASQGYGLVKRFIIEETEQDYSLYDAEGNLIRTLPDPNARSVYGIRPPYWLPENQALCHLPF
jgi:CRISPR type IV-associated protein Csf3